MNRINRLFQQKQKNILNIYCTAGYPTLDATVSIIQTLEEAGADLIEIGMPYSDPLADGPTIQASSTKALKNGMSIPKLLEQLEDIRPKTKLPIILMGYLNPVLQYGLENFLKKCQEVGVDGLILPDLPLDEYQEEYQVLFEKYGIQIIFLVTPQTSNARIQVIDNLSNAFIYVVSTASITGKSTGFEDKTLAYFQKIKDMQLKNPCLIGFGISDHKSYQTACDYANGAIIGSEFIRTIENSQQLTTDISTFIKNIRSLINPVEKIKTNSY